MYVILIHPFESASDDWEIRQFKSEKDAKDAFDRLELTEKSYILPIEFVAKLINKQ